MKTRYKLLVAFTVLIFTPIASIYMSAFAPPSTAEYANLGDLLITGLVGLIGTIISIVIGFTDGLFTKKDKLQNRKKFPYAAFYMPALLTVLTALIAVRLF